MNDNLRQFFHMSIIFVAIIFKFIGRWEAILLFLLASFISSLVVMLPGISKVIHRPYEKTPDERLFPVFSYAFSVALLIYFLPLYIAIPAWCALAIGDAVSTVFGMRYGKKKLKWNFKKSYAGSSAFVIFTFIGMAFFTWWFKPDYGLTNTIIFSLIGSFAGAIIESLPLRIEDNMTIPLGTAAILYLVSFFL